MIPREIIEEVRDRNDIEQVIGSYVTLKKAGSNTKGLCPFHNEKTPSFTVYPGSQSFYCFGCGAGGDVITFIMKYNNLDYASAVEYLAQRVGITVPSNGKAEERGVSKKRVLEMNLCAAKYFRSCLFGKSGEAAMDYLTRKRRLSVATIKRFGLGFAPNSYNEMLVYMRSQGFSDEELCAGYFEAVSHKNDKTYSYSVFRNRIIFPIIDTSGNIIAFGGRVMDDSKPKYLNTNDTPAYKKGRNLFALNYAKDSCAERLILCEGYMDVIALHAAGFGYAVAGLGTALTPEQARLISKYAKKVILTYDSDEAGQKATERSMQLLGEVGLDVRVLVVTGAKDPDEFIKAYGASEFEKLLDGSRTKFSYRSGAILKKYDITQPDDKIAAAKEICTLIASVASAVEREVYTNEAAKELGIEASVLGADVTRLHKKYLYNVRTKQARDAYSEAKGLGDRINPDTAKNVGAAAAEEVILGLLMCFPEHRHAVCTGKVQLTENDFMTAFGKRVFVSVCELENNAGGFDFSLLGESFSPDEMGRMQKMIRARLDLTENGSSVFETSVSALKNEREKQQANNSSDRLTAILEQRRAELKRKKENNT